MTPRMTDAVPQPAYLAFQRATLFGFVGLAVKGCLVTGA